MNVPLTLLGLLERGPSHGYDLKRDYDMYFGRGKHCLAGILTPEGERFGSPGSAMTPSVTTGAANCAGTGSGSCSSPVSSSPS
jgi:hypothetical protein